MLRKLLICMISSLLWVGGLCSQEKPGRSVLDGVYTDSQAKRGQAEYEMSCAKCHEGADVDGPPLTGDPFIDRWREDKLTSLFIFVRTQMPRDTPGKLPEADYRDILAFLLQANGYPAGTAELTAAAIDNTELVGKDGPTALPTNALVVVVGCLAPGEKDSWTLTHASRPARTRIADASTADEMNNSKAKPLGDQQFMLQDLADLRSGFNPASDQGHKIQIKGVLIRQTNRDRIHATSLENLAEKCQ